jgi:hypothetical protein
MEFSPFGEFSCDEYKFDKSGGIPVYIKLQSLAVT